MRSGFRNVVRERGLSLVELLVAMAIGLIGTIIIFQVFNASEGVRRSTSSGGDAQQTGAIALYAIEHDLRQAGMGFSDPTWVGCTVWAYDDKRSTKQFSFPLVPVFITPGADAKHADTIAVLYGSQPILANGVPLLGAYNSANLMQEFGITNPWEFKIGDVMVLLAGPPPNPSPCFLMELTKVDTSPTTRLWHVPGGSRFNPPGGFHGGPYPAGPFAFPQTSVVYNLGNYLNASTTPVFNTYFIDSNTLKYTAAFSSNPTPAAADAPAVADNIVHMRADYVLDDGTFKTPDLASPPDWSKVVAIRVAVVARSRLPEKPSGTSGCDTTAAAPTWSGTATAPFDLSADANWKCYRYRAFETTVPLRNWIWHN
jgi:type IV pilus assembly protein PilW